MISKEWESSGTKKIVLKVSDEKELMEIYQKLKDAKFKPSLIKDAGHTEIPSGTITASVWVLCLKTMNLYKYKK